MSVLLPVFQAIREETSDVATSWMGFLHPITDTTVTISAHGCASHSWTRKISAPSSNPSSPYGTLRRKGSMGSNLNVRGGEGRKVSAPSRMSSSGSGFSTLPRVGGVCVCRIAVFSLYVLGYTLFFWGNPVLCSLTLM